MCVGVKLWPGFSAPACVLIPMESQSGAPKVGRGVCEQREGPVAPHWPGSRQDCLDVGLRPLTPCCGLRLGPGGRGMRPGLPPRWGRNWLLQAPSLSHWHLARKTQLLCARPLHGGRGCCSQRWIHRTLVSGHAPAAPARHPHVRSLLSGLGGWTRVEALEAQVWAVAAAGGVHRLPWGCRDLGVEA